MDDQSCQRDTSNFQSSKTAGKGIVGKRPSPNLDSKPKRKKQKSTDSFPKSYTDSDVELYEAAAVLSPATCEGGKRKAAPLTRNKTAPPILNLEDEDSLTAFLEASYKGKATIDDLPDVLQEMFCRLPAIDLVHFVAPVSRRFYQIICHQNFLEWKKLYARYLRRDNAAVHRIESEIRNEMAEPDRSLGPMELIRFMATVPKLTDHETETALERLALHPHHAAAVGIVKRAYFAQGQSDVASKNSEEDPPTLGALVAALILISDNVESMTRIVHLLTAQPAFCKAVYWIEFFYCLLTMLQYYSHLGILKDGRHHYQLKYAIYFLENGGKKSYKEVAAKAGQRNTGGVAGQLSLNQFVGRQERLPTYEQYRIIGHNMKAGDYVRIIAFAGTGKTTTLLEYCRARPHMKFLVVFFNTDVAVDARSRFPSNAVCRTIHSLAYGKVGWKYRDQIEYGNIRLDAIIGECKEEIKGIDRYVRASLIRETLTNFFASDLEDIRTTLVPHEWKSMKRNGKSTTIYLELDVKILIVQQTEKFWEAMQDLRNSNVRMPHEGYLKLYQLSKPKLWGYDALLIDEAQDQSPAALDIFQRQEHLPKMLVGDGYQQIYSFRGAINALNRIPSTKTFYLTQSFRFGSQIAYVANSWMRTMLGEEKKFLIGTDKPSRLDGVVEGQMAVICRTNFTVFNECVLIADQLDGRQSLSVGTATKPFDFETLEALFYLYLSEKSREKLPARKPEHWIIRKDFKTFNDVKLFAAKVHDIDLMSKISIVEKHGVLTGDRIQAIKACLVRDPKFADFVVTTAHKSKGLEFKTVRLADDFGDQLAGDDKNLIYVAMTRAMNSLILSEDIYSILNKRLGPMFYSPLFPTVAQVEPCTKCRQIPPGGQAKYLHRKPLAVCHVTGFTKTYGQVRLCKACVTNAIENGDEEDIFDYVTPNGDDLKERCFQFYLPFLE